MNDTNDDRLSDSTDPFEILGVSPNCDDRELKRAYVRLIKRFRPDVDPESFQRVRRAWEQAQEALQYGALLLDAQFEDERDDDGDGEDERHGDDAIRSHEGPHSETEQSRWRSRDEGETGTENETDAEPSARQAEDATDLDRVLHGLRHGDDVSGWLDFSDDTMLDRCWQEDLLRWEVLQHQPEKGLAAYLLEAGFERDLLAERAYRVIDAIDPESGAGHLLQTARLSVPALDRVIERMLGLTTWTNPARALKCLELEPATNLGENGLEWGDNVARLVLPWHKVQTVFDPPRALDRLLRLGTLERNGAPAVLPEVVDALTTHPHAWLQAVDAIQETSPELSAHLEAVVGAWCFDPAETLTEHSTPERIARGLQPIIEASLGRARSILFAVTAPPLAAVGLGAHLLGWGCVGVFVAALGAYLWFLGARLFARRLGARLIRPVLARAIVTEGVSRSSIERALEQRRGSPLGFWSFEYWLKTDAALAHLEPIAGAFHEVGGGESPETPASTMTRLEHCSAHPDKEVAGSCRGCQRGLCEQCDRIAVGANDFCPACEETRVQRHARQFGAREKEVLLVALLDLLVLAFGFAQTSGLVHFFVDEEGRTLALSLPSSPSGQWLVTVWVLTIAVAALGMGRIERWGLALQLVATLPFVLPAGALAGWVGVHFLSASHLQEMRHVFSPTYKPRLTISMITLQQKRGSWVFDALVVAVAAATLVFLWVPQWAVVPPP